MNKVDNLLKNPFKNLKHEEQLEIKKLGQYQPRDINIFQKDGRKLRTFSSTWFDKKSWLTACDERKSLFCFCSLLFGGESLWTNKGCNDLKHLSEQISKHECSKAHMNNCVSLQMFEKINRPILSAIFFIFIFYIYIYLPDSQESDGCAIHRVSNYPDLLPERSTYCCPLVI